MQDNNIGVPRNNFRRLTFGHRDPPYDHVQLCAGVFLSGDERGVYADRGEKLSNHTLGRWGSILHSVVAVIYINK